MKFFFTEALYQQDRWHIFNSANICEYNMMINGNLTKNMPLPFFGSLLRLKQGLNVKIRKCQIRKISLFRKLQLWYQWS